jgi:hypothetical protein
VTFKKPKHKYILLLPLGVFAAFMAVFFGYQKTEIAQAACALVPNPTNPFTICLSGPELTYDQIDFTTQASYKYKKADGTAVSQAGNALRIGKNVTELSITVTGKVVSPASIIAGYKNGYNRLKFPGANIVASPAIWGFGTGTVKDDTACSNVSIGGSDAIPLVWQVGGQTVKSCSYIDYKETIYNFVSNPVFLQFQPGATPGPLDGGEGQLLDGFQHTYALTWSTLESSYGLKDKASGAKFEENCMNVKGALETANPAGANLNGIKAFAGVGTYWVKRNNKFCFEVYATQAEADAVTEPLPKISDDPTGSGTGDTTPPNGGGSTLGNVINEALTWIILAMTRIIYWIFASVLAPLIESLLKIHPYQDVFVDAIFLGWQLIRNLCNIFFIVILLVIGLGTLFRVESYNYKHLLVKVVIAALLVNFSLVFGQAILGVADTVQQQFLPDSSNVIRALGSKLMVEPINLLTQSAGTETASAGATFAGNAKPMFAFALALGAFFTFVALAAFLVIRIVALWVLLLVSPIAYVANILPNTASYSKQWWEKFLKYAFMTPVLAFFLNLAAVFVTSTLSKTNVGNLLHTEGVSGDVSQFVYIAGSQILTILFILVGLKAASSSGTYGAAAISNFAEKGIRKPFEWAGKAGLGAAKLGGGRAFEAIQNKAGITLDPRLLKKAGQEYFAEQKAKRLQARATRNLFGMKHGPKVGDAKSNFEAYANLRGVKRAVWDSKFGTRGAGYNTEKSKQAEALYKAYTPEERAAELEKQRTLAGQLRDFDSNKTDAQARAKAMKAEIAGMEGTYDAIPPDKQPAYKKAIDDKKKEFADFQRDNELEYSDKTRQKLKDDFEKTKDGLAKDTAAKEKYGIGTVTPEMKAEAYKEMKRYDEQASKTKRPEGYAAIAAHHHLLSDEKKKIEHIDEADRLIQLYKDAVVQGERYKAEAVMQKLAKDVNFNELLENKYGKNDYKTFVDHFTKSFAKDFKLSEHEALEAMSEVSYINEGNHVYNLARAIEVDKHGHMKALSEADHNKIIATQMKKVEPQGQARVFWRGAFVDEELNDHDDVSKGKKFKLHSAGIRILKDSLAKGDGLKHVAGRMQEYNRNAIKEALRDQYNTGNAEIDELHDDKDFMAALDGKPPSGGKSKPASDDSMMD